METLDGLSKVQLNLYSLDHGDGKGNTLSLHAYGASRISNNSVNLKRNHDIFPEAFPIDYGFSGTASVLLGLKIARYYPDAIQCKADLV